VTTIAEPVQGVTLVRPTAVYRFFNADDQLLYVGITFNLGARFNAHERSSAWWSHQRSVKVVWRDTRNEALAEESAAIQAEKPIHNVAGTRPPQVRIRKVRLDPSTREAIAREVRGEVARAGVSKRNVRESLGLSTQSLWERMTGQIAFTDEELYELADLLGISVTCFFRGVPA
jgi:excinuclease UvrABC nuclease subunit